MSCRVVFCCVLSLVTASSAAGEDANHRLIIDADTGNEIDDLYAILRVLNQDRFEVVGLTSCQWRHHLGPRDSLSVSQRDNVDLLNVCGRPDLPHPAGSEDPFGKPWGGTQPQDSPAARFIIEQARKTPAGEKLVVVCTGAATNVASAVKLQPEIASRISVYLVGFRYDFERAVWNKSEFNVRRDLDAADFLLDTEGLDLTIMPLEVSGQLVFDREDSFTRQQKLGDVGRHLTTKWTRKFSDHDVWTMWDVALVEAVVRPELATTRDVTTPPENTQRTVRVYDSIDAGAMKVDFWSTLAEAYSSP